ncbi:MAG: PAS domain-containing protein [Anaplasmataceae bacterium]|nr:PAS domain-containing protein [Anaplasmataceae bacterium]
MKKSPFTTLWKQHEPMIQAIVELFSPFVEAAVHDLEKGKIVAIYHNISQRKIGDLSPLKELKVETKDFPDYFVPYYKKNWDGRPLKCTSITLRDTTGKAIGLICINVDTSFMQDAHRLLETFLKTTDKAENPIELFGAQCEEQATAMIQQYIDDKHLALNFLNREQKKELVQHLYHKGIFNYKNATFFISKKLKISRASIYNYIKHI